MCIRDRICAGIGFITNNFGNATFACRMNTKTAVCTAGKITLIHYYRAMLSIKRME